MTHRVRRESDVHRMRKRNFLAFGGYGRGKCFANYSVCLWMLDVVTIFAHHEQPFFLLLLPLIVFLFFFFFPLSFLISLSPPLPPPPLLSILLNFIFLRPFPSTSFIRPETDSRVLGLNADGRRKSCRGITIWEQRHGFALWRVNKCLGCWRSSLATDSFLPTKGYEAWNSCAARWMPTLRKGLLLLLLQHDAIVLHESIPLLELSHND